MLNNLQTNFTLGELAPELQGWVDLPNFKRGVYLAENFLVGPNGGLTFRPGTYYSANTYGNSYGKLIPFIYSDGSVYVIEATPGLFRFHTNGGPLLVSYATTAGSWTSSTATLTIGAHCFLVGDTITVAGVSPSGYNGTFVITAVTSTTISYALASNPGSYTSAGTVQGTYQVTTPYTSAQTPVRSCYVQSDDVLYMTDPTGTNPPQQLARTGAATFTLSAVAFTAGPFLDANITATTMTVSSGTHVAASAATFASTDVGRLIMILDPSDTYNNSIGMYKWGTITTYTDSQHVIIDAWKYTVGTIDTAQAFVATGAQTEWRLGAWSATTGYPHRVAIHQERLLFGYDTKQQTVTGSVSGYYNGFSPFDPDGTVNPDNAFRYNLASGQADQIMWLISGKDLYIGTTDAEYAVTSTGPAITPSDINIKLQTTIGSSGKHGPVYLNYRLMMMQRGGFQLNEWAYAYFLGGYIGAWANQQSAHITYPGISNMDRVTNPFTRLVLNRKDGQLVIATDSSESKGGIASTPGGILGFTRYVPAGTYSTGAAQVEESCVIPAIGYDQIWMVVLRTINGNTVRTVEYLTPDFNWDTAATMADAFQVDCGLTYSGSSTSTISGLDHLEGQDVVGWDITNSLPIAATVSGGSITLTTATSNAVVGLSYTGTCKTMQLSDPRIQGHTEYAVRAYLRLYNTYNGYVLTGPKYDQIELLSESSGNLYSGMTRNLLSQGSETAPAVSWGQVSPYPMTVLCVSTDYTVGNS